MSKPIKYTPDTTKKLLDAIRSGFTVKAACAMVGVTDITISRWRRRYPDFDAAFKVQESLPTPSVVGATNTQTPP